MEYAHRKSRLIPAGACLVFAAGFGSLAGWRINNGIEAGHAASKPAAALPAPTYTNVSKGVTPRDGLPIPGTANENPDATALKEMHDSDIKSGESAALIAVVAIAGAAVTIRKIRD